MNAAVGDQKAKRTPLKSLADLIVIAAYLVVVPQLAEAAFVEAGLPTTGLTRILATGVIFAGLVAVVVVLLALRGETLRDIGLQSPRNLAGAAALGVAVAALTFAGLEALQRLGVMGETRLGDMASELKGDLPLAFARAGLGLIVVGFVEELLFRGFVLDRLAKAFGSGVLALGGALAGQAALFALAHAYQGVEGMLFTGAVGLLFGIAFVAAGRNLWPVIIAHGVFDAARAMHLYLVLTAAR